MGWGGEEQKRAGGWAGDEGSVPGRGSEQETGNREDREGQDRAEDDLLARGSEEGGRHRKSWRRGVLGGSGVSGWRGMAVDAAAA